MSSSDSNGLSLLSLSIAAAHAAPIPIDNNNHQAPSAGTISIGNPSTTTNNAGGKHHRRLSSTGRTRRRMSDARDAATRPLSTANAALSLASLSLSTSSPDATSAFVSQSPTLSIRNGNGSTNGGISKPLSSVDGYGARSVSPPSAPRSEVKPIAILGNGKNKKRGMDHKCETCSKVYRHPSCLIKHRWEHTPHWREASKFVLSKHQQVQLLEAAAILSHFSPDATGTSLPEDRSLWPSFLCGGSLPSSDVAQSPSSASNSARSIINDAISHRRQAPISSSVPTRSSSRRSRSGSAAPQLHNYSITSSGITQLRPGLLSVSTSTSSASASTTTSTPVLSTTAPVPITGRSISHGSGRSTSGSASHPHSAGGWSLPSSSLRSSSVSDEDSLDIEADEDDDVMDEDDYDDFEYDEDDADAVGDMAMINNKLGTGRRYYGNATGNRKIKEEDEDLQWDGGDMEMEMD